MILRGRIRTQLYLLLMAVAVPLSVLVGVEIVDDMRHDEEQAGGTARMLALSVADEAQEALADTRDHLGRLARLLLSVPPGEAGCDSALDPFLKLNRRFIAAFVLDGLGRPVCIHFASDSEDDIGGGRPAGSDLSWLETVPPGSQGPVVVRAADGPRVIQTYPIGEPGGGRQPVVGALVAMDSFILNLDVSRFPRGTTYGLTDAQGRFLGGMPQAGPRSERGPGGLHAAGLISSAHATEDVAVGIDGVERLYASSDVPGSNWRVLAGIPTAGIYAPAHDLAVRNALIALAIVVCVGLFAWNLARRIARPIQRIADAARSVAAGRADVRVEVSGPRELAEVAERFNAMLDSRRRAEQRLLESDQRLRALSRQLLSVQEAERRDIARELHDEVGQALTAVRINLEAMVRTSPPEDRCVSVARDCVGIVGQTLRQVRNLCLDLRPPQLDDLGLVAAVRWQLDRQTQAAGLDARLAASGIETGLDPNLATACFRVVQEALTNVVRHAAARHVWVELRQRGELLSVLVRDDGKGFEVADARARAVRGGSIGLLSMQERTTLAGGRFCVSSKPGSGTKIRAEFPRRQVGSCEGAQAMEVHG